MFSTLSYQLEQQQTVHKYQRKMLREQLTIYIGSSDKR